MRNYIVIYSDPHYALSSPLRCWLSGTFGLVMKGMVTNAYCGFSQRLIYGALIHNQTLRVCLALNSICGLVCD